MSGEPLRVLLLHPDFPGQYIHLAAALAADPSFEVVAIGDADRAAAAVPPGVRLIRYRARGAGDGVHHYVRSFEAAVRRGQAVARQAIALARSGWQPAVICVHPGWGDGLFLRDVFPDARIIVYCEFYYRSRGADVGFDPEYPASLDDRLGLRIRNAPQLLSLEAADVGISPTEWQRRQYPLEFRRKISVLHDGIDAQALQPDPAAVLTLEGGRRLVAGDEVVTYVARGLEPCRGFHVFMRALPLVLERRPQAQVVIVGGDAPAYGPPPAGGGSFRERLVAELGDRLDHSRVHFLGTVGYQRFRSVLQVSAAHVYLTYPFVLSWSMLEAMANGCLVIGSRTPPVQEVLSDGDNGRLVDFFSSAGLARTVCDVLADPGRHRLIRERARQSVLDSYALADLLPRQIELIRRLGQGNRPQPLRTAATG